MEQEPLTQRVKFLAEALAESVRAFGVAVGEKQTTTSNYITGRNKPSADFLERIVIRFRNVSAHWLLTGEGEPFLSTADPQVRELNSVYQKNKKIIGGQIIGQVGRDAINNHGFSTDERAAMQTQIDMLREQVADKERTIKAQERIIRLLEGQPPKP